MASIYGPIKYFSDELMKTINERSKEILSFLYPPATVYEENGELVVKLDMPGFKKEDISVKVSKNSLEISAEREPLKNKNIILNQRPEKIWKTISLPLEISEEEDIVAKYEAGVLHLRMKIKGLRTLKIE
ncbi:archaeal heat shock protein Hsp14 [Caldiplasma sukawensis]